MNGDILSVNSYTVTRRKVYSMSAEELESFLRELVKSDTAEVEFDVSSGGFLRGASITVTEIEEGSLTDD